MSVSACQWRTASRLVSLMGAWVGREGWQQDAASVSRPASGAQAPTDDAALPRRGGSTSLVAVKAFDEGLRML